MCGIILFKNYDALLLKEQVLRVDFYFNWDLLPFHTYIEP
jgi:predicted DNA-binding protein YlxM (UPF0122 family)